MSELLREDELIVEFKTLPEQLGIPAIDHPWFQALINGQFTEEQILLGELQHTRRGWFLEKVVQRILDKALSEGDEEVIEVARANYEEEAGGPKPHGDLMFQFHEDRGMSKEDVEAVELMPGTLACMAMLGEGVQRFTALGSLAMMTLPEWQNAHVSAEVHSALKATTNFSDYAIDTYRVHAIADIDHGNNQLGLLARKLAADSSLGDHVFNCLVYGAEAFNHNWDGQYQAATNNPLFRT